MNEPSLKELLRDLKEGDEADRRYAAEDLGDLQNPIAVPALAKALRDKAVSVREAAVDALISIGGEKVCEEMVKLLDDDNSAVRNAALEVFERLRATAIPYCIELYKSDSHDLRKIAVDTLGKIEETKGTEGYNILIEALNDKHINVAQAACEALGKLAEENVVDVFSKHFGKHSWMDSTILLSLVKIGTPDAKKFILSLNPKELNPEVVFTLNAVKTMIV